MKNRDKGKEREGEMALITDAKDNRLLNSYARGRELLLEDSLRAMIAERDAAIGAKEKAEKRVKELECQKKALQQVNEKAEAEAKRLREAVEWALCFSTNDDNTVTYRVTNYDDRKELSRRAKEGL